MTLPRFYPILDTQVVSERGYDVFAAAESILSAGARILQFRHKGFFGRDTFELAERVAAICARRGVLFVMNDRADFAKLLGAGLHVGQDDLPPTEARAVVGDSVIGYSTHNEEQLRAAADEPADYLAFGPVCSTASKANPDPVTGTAELARLRPLSTRPLVAIGGITRENARSVLAAGADSVAGIGDLYPRESAAASTGNRTVANRTEEWLRLVHES
jgi:thiamine-phosphate pyrophosphorylase